MVSQRTPELMGGFGMGYEFKSKTNHYTVDVYRSNHGNKATFQDLPEYADLVHQIVDLYLRVYPQRDADKSIERIFKSLSYPRTIVEQAFYGDELVGVGIFPRYYVDGEAVLYSSRFMLPEHAGQGLGPHILEDAILRHQQELANSHRSLRWGALMTMNPDSLVSLWKLPIVGETFPISKPINDQVDPTINLYPQGSIPQRLMLGVHSTVYMSSRSIDTATGVSKGELSELGMNETYRPSREYAKSYSVHQKMVAHPPDGLAMNREAGDEVYVVFELKRPNYILAEVSPMV